MKECKSGHLLKVGREITVPKSATSDDIHHATTLFSSNGESRRGFPLKDVEIRFYDFSNKEAMKTQTVGEMYEFEKPSGIL